MLTGKSQTLQERKPPQANRMSSRLTTAATTNPLPTTLWRPVFSLRKSRYEFISRTINLLLHAHRPSDLAVASGAVRCQVDEGRHASGRLLILARG